MKEMQGIEVEEEIDVQIELNVSSYIPDEFIENSSQKIEIYQDIALCKNEEDIQNIIDEIIDRYGNMPEEVESLIDIARIKNLARNLYITKVMQKMNGVIFYFDPKKFNMEIVDILLKEYRNKIKFSPGKEPYITYRIDDLSDNKLLYKIKEFLKSMMQGSDVSADNKQ